MRASAAVHGWLLLLPAAALLALFTHWPVVGTLWDSFHATPKGGRAAPFVGLENYQVMVADEVFWRSRSSASRHVSEQVVPISRRKIFE